MIITFLGQTDKRTVLYTMLKMCEYMGDCAVVSNDRKLMRLMEEGPGDAGTYRNIDIFVTDATADEVWAAIDHAPHDYDYIFLDNLYTEETDLVVYIKGAGVDEIDQMNLQAFEPGELITIKMGKADKPPKVEKVKGRPVEAAPKVYNIPYTASIPEKVEACEFFRELVPISSQAIRVCAEVLSGPTNTPVKVLVQTASRVGQKGAMKK